MRRARWAGACRSRKGKDSLTGSPTGSYRAGMFRGRDREIGSAAVAAAAAGRRATVQHRRSYANRAYDFREVCRFREVYGVADLPTAVVNHVPGRTTSAPADHAARAALSPPLK